MSHDLVREHPAIRSALVPLVSFASVIAPRAPTASAQVRAEPAVEADVPPASAWLRGRSELLRAPARVASDPAGNSYVTDPAAGRVIVRDRFGRLAAVRLGLRAPSGIAVGDDGFAYVIESAVGRVSIFAPGWIPAGALGKGDGEFLLPADVAVDPVSGALFVADAKANRIRVFGPDGSFHHAFGGAGSLPGQLSFPTGLHFSRGGELLVADQGNRRVQVFDGAGTLLRCFPVKATRIVGVAADARGRVYVADALEGRLEVRDPFGAWLGTVGRWGDGAGGLRTPTGVAFDPFGRLLVASGSGGSVELFGIDAFQDPRVLSATVAVEADSLAAAQEGALVSVTIELAVRSAAEIDPASVTANGVPAGPRMAVVGDPGLDGPPDLRVWFDAAALRATLSGDPAWIVLTGELWDGTPLDGATPIHLAPSGGSR